MARFSFSAWVSKMRTMLAWWMLLLGFLAAPVLAADANPVLTELLTKGVPLDAGPPVKLPELTMPDGLDEAGQQERLASIADAGHPIDALIRKAVVAPFVLKVGGEKRSTNCTARALDLWFVAYGDLETIADEGFLKEQVEAKQKAGKDDLPSTVKLLTEEELAKRKIKVQSTDAVRERYVAAQFDLFDRVQVSGTGRAIETVSKESVLAAGMLDPRFADDKEHPNQWRKITRDDSNKLTLGEPHPYAGVGGYVKATRLHKPAGAIFIEYHLVFNEPTQDWFNGANLLASKLPLITQDGVRKFRGNLVKASKGK